MILAPFYFVKFPSVVSSISVPLSGFECLGLGVAAASFLNRYALCKDSTIKPMF
jgi:hypothetical protein